MDEVSILLLLLYRRRRTDTLIPSLTGTSLFLVRATSVKGVGNENETERIFYEKGLAQKQRSAPLAFSTYAPFRWTYPIRRHGLVVGAVRQCPCLRWKREWSLNYRRHSRYSSFRTIDVSSVDRWKKGRGWRRWLGSLWLRGQVIVDGKAVRRSWNVLLLIIFLTPWRFQCCAR